MIRVTGDFMAAGGGRVFKVYVLEQWPAVGSNANENRPTLMSREGLLLDQTETEGEYFVPKLSLVVRKVGPLISQPHPGVGAYFNA